MIALVMLVTVLSSCAGSNKHTSPSVNSGHSVSESSSGKHTSKKTLIDPSSTTMTSSDEGTSNSSKPDNTPALEDCLAKMSNYTVKLGTEFGGEIYDEIYYFSNNSMKFQYEDMWGDSYTEYVLFKNDGTTDYYSDFSGTEYDCYFVINSRNDCYISVDYSSYTGLGSIAPADYTLVSGGKYSYTGADVNQAAKTLLYDEDDEEYGVSELFSSIEISVSERGILAIECASVYNDSEEEYQVTYRLEFTDIGSTPEISLLQNPITITDANYDEYFGDNGGNDVDDLFFSGLPTTGSVKALVLPVAFSNYSFTEKKLNDLAKAFNGSAADTGWQSVSSFYRISSGGKLDLSFEIADVYTMNITSRQFGEQYVNYYNGEGTEEPVDGLLDTILAYYDGKYNYSDYDLNEDGCIDAVYLIYAAPIVYDSTGNESDDLWWSWQTYSYSEQTVDDVYPGYYVWSGIDSLYESVIYGEDHVGADVKINALTLIHETGHLMDLEDYYDNDPEIGPAGGLGGADMMDSTVGDHCAFSKIQLGWIKPTIVQSSMKLTIGGLSDTGNCIVICKDEKGLEGEYILIDLYLPTGLNALTAGYYGLPENACVRIYHVNATMGSYTDEWGDEMYGYLCSNSSTEYKLIKLLEADGNNSIENTDRYEEGEYAVEEDYYHTGDVLPATYTWQDGTAFDFTVQVISVNEDTGEAVIDIRFQ